MKTRTKLLAGLGFLAIISPIGLALPELFKAGPAWGEWGTDELQAVAGFVPAGLEKLSALWHPFMRDYEVSGSASSGKFSLSLAYIVSAIAGIALCLAAGWLIGKLLSAKKG
jgi:hypothetical protein